MQNNKKFLVGSSYFFSQYDDFVSKDKDYVLIVDGDTEFKYNREIHLNGTCVFEIKKVSPTNIINRINENGSPMQIGKFLVPEFSKAIGFNFQDIELLRPAIEKLDKKHLYEKIIFDAYIENGDFVLNDEQRRLAYEEYKSEREEN